MPIDHIAVPARDVGASARRLATILGAPEPSIVGAGGDMHRVEVGQGAFILFAPAPHVHPLHVAFHLFEVTC